jgi:hypothetical protein
MIVSEELTGNETASILGAAIGKPDLNLTRKTSTNEAVQPNLQCVAPPSSIQPRIRPEVD